MKALKFIVIVLCVISNLGMAKIKVGVNRSKILSADTVSAKIIAIVPIDEQRVKEIATLLPDKPKGFGFSYKDRLVWDELLKSGKFNKLIGNADQVLKAGLPPLTDETYLSFFNSNDSETSKQAVMKRRAALFSMVMAECLLNNNKYIEAIKKGFTDIITQKSWTFPAEDKKKTNYNGTQYTVNLSSADYAFTLAQAMFMLDDKLDAETRGQIKNALHVRVFKPTLRAIETANKNYDFPALTNSGNHNSVTLSGVTSAALAVIDDKKERAIYVAIAERYSRNYINGFLEDGYCTEGLGYYNYGFTNYCVLRENILQNTKGKLDLFQNSMIKKMALFGPGMEIVNTVYPTIGDCTPGTKPDAPLMNYISRNLQLGLRKYESNNRDVYSGSSFGFMSLFSNSASQSSPAKITSPDVGLRTYFNSANVINVRPNASSGIMIGASFKGGNNDEKHNHNDIGSYTIVAGNDVIMGDPGVALYTSKTFTSERYSIKSLTSYGHPVPIIAGQLQRTGPSAKAIVVDKKFTPDEDRISMDLTSAYDAPELKNFTRIFIYDRTGGSVEVNDKIEFTKEQTYETAITTRAKWKQTSTNTILLEGGKEKMTVLIKVPGTGFTIHPEQITDAKVPYTRLGIKLNELLKSGTISMNYKPTQAN